MPGRLTLVVQLYIHPSQSEEYERFESEASRIMARHGGRIARRVSLQASDSDTPDEVHVVTFPSEESFQTYVEDPELTSLADLRARAIRRTVVWHGTDMPGFT